MLDALTLIQPWAYAVAHLGKPIENRAWRPPSRNIGRPLAIHAGKSYDEEGADWIRSRFGVLVPPADQLARGAIVAVVTLATCVEESVFEDIEAHPRIHAGRPWFVGPFGWVLTNLVVLPHPVTIRGAQKLWRVPEPELGQVRAGYAAARRAA